MRNALRIVLALLFVSLLAAGIGAPRGARADIIQFTASIDGAQETPPTGSPATGTGTFTMDTDLNTLVIHVEFSGLPTAENAAHIHGFAGPGIPAGILFPLPLGSPKDATWTFNEAQQPNIIGGSTYVNIHSIAFPGGEIRGQILQVPPPVPLMSRWGVVVFAAALLAAGAVMLRRRRATSTVA